MNTVEFIKVIHNIPVKREICAKDLLPEKKPLDMKAYIMNTDISTDPEHWVAVYFRKDQAIYFDSYGRLPEEQYALSFLETLQDASITQNVYRFQIMWNMVYLHYSSAQQMTRSKHSHSSRTIWNNLLKKIYTRMTEILRCGSAITMPESSYHRTE